MSNQPTQDHVHVANFHGSSDIERDGGEPLAIGMEPENARRLAACWNACTGIETEELLGAVHIGQPIKAVMDRLIAERTQALAEVDHLRAELDNQVRAMKDLFAAVDAREVDLAAARALLRKVIGETDAVPFLPACVSQGLADRMRLFLDDTNYLNSEAGVHLSTIKCFAEQVINVADILGFVVTTSQVSRMPLAMGNYDTVVSVRPARGRAS